MTPDPHVEQRLILASAYHCLFGVVGQVEAIEFPCCRGQHRTHQGIRLDGWITLRQPCEQPERWLVETRVTEGGLTFAAFLDAVIESLEQVSVARMYLHVAVDVYRQPA